MATAYKVLGQQAPAATTDASLYTVPAATEAVVSTISVCNRGSASGTYRIAVRPAGASIADQHYVAYDAPLDAKASETWTIGVTVTATDVITVHASTADFSFSAFGSEIS
jgi:hypothetical protein